MKKVTLLVATLLMLSMSQVNAQESNTDNSGKFALEVQTNPLNFTTPVFSIDALRGRYQLNNGDNLRLEMTFSSTGTNGKPNLSIPLEENYATTAAFETAMESYEYALKEYDKVRSGHLALYLGYEHFLNTDSKLKPYIGGQAGLAKYFFSEHILDYTQKADGTWYSEEERYTNCDASGSNAYFVFSLGAFAGVDFYLYEGLYLGAELQATAAWNMNTNTKYHYTTDNTSATTPEFTTKTNGRNTTLSLNYSVTPMLRLGWRF